MVAYYWTSDSKDKVRAQAKAEKKLLVLTYQAWIDGDLCAAMTPAEYEEEKKKFAGPRDGWIKVVEDYTEK